MLTLYYSPGACALASHIALKEVGADHDLVRIDLRQGEQKTPEYLAINPAGKTPALKTAQGVITQNPAILRYLVDTHPEARLVPGTDAFSLARFDAMNGYLSSSLHPALSKLLFSGLQGEAKDEARQAVLAQLAFVEANLLVGPFLFGEAYTASDGYLAVFTRWARSARLLGSEFPKLNEHVDRVQARPAVQAALAAEGLAVV